MTNIAICCDGTWNTPDEKDGGAPTPTNVVRLYNCLARQDNGGAPQKRYYHPGVGTDGTWWNKLVSGGTGEGLDKNIMSAYYYLCREHKRGDAIYLFGFSRGAYTVRSLAGFVSHSGLLDISNLSAADTWSRIDRVFNKGYREKAEDRATWDKAGWAFQNPTGQAVPIRFLGVWDTVGALGIPDDLALLNLIDNLHDYTFHDTVLSPTVQTARHAVAIDEMRASFQPTLWQAPANVDAKQVWFPGVHSDVGGGYKEIGLSDGALAWMIDEARAAGLGFDDPTVGQVKANALDVLHNSCSGVFALFPTQPRSVPQIVAGSLVHGSALARQKTPPISQCPYWLVEVLQHKTPFTLDVFALQPWNATGLWLDAGTSYKFSATGEWMDASITCGPEGSDDGKLHFAEIAQVMGTVLGKAEELFKKVSGNKAADFKGTRRHEDMPWFSLVGAIANSPGAANGQPVPHEAFPIGKGCTYSPKSSGYFYAYANDAWNFYGNNRGHVRLTIERAA